MIDEVLNRYSRHVEFLGEDLTDVHQVGSFGSQVIHLASFVNRCSDIVEILRAGGDLNAVGDLGLTALHYAVLGRSIDAVDLLISNGANLATENEFGETPLQMAHLLEYNDIEERIRNAGAVVSWAHDGGSIARDRWLDFKAIQDANFERE